jgi:hypothetical protein
MEAISQAEMSSRTNDFCIGRMVNSIGLQTIGATSDLQTASNQVQALVEAFPADYVVYRRDSGRVVAKTSPVARAIELVLERSADAQIRRRGFARDSRAFHTATGAISAYGKVLSLLSKLQADKYRLGVQS